MQFSVFFCCSAVSWSNERPVVHSVLFGQQNPLFVSIALFLFFLPFVRVPSPNCTFGSTYMSGIRRNNCGRYSFQGHKWRLAAVGKSQDRLKNDCDFSSAANSISFFICSLTSFHTSSWTNDEDSFKHGCIRKWDPPGDSEALTAAIAT